MARRRAGALVALALLAAGCGPRREETADPSREEQVQQTLQRYRITAEDDRQMRAKYPDIYLHIQDWREAVLDHADRQTLAHLRTASHDRIKSYEAQDAELAPRPPYIVIDARRAIRDQIALEVERLRLIESKLGAAR